MLNFEQEFSYCWLTLKQTNTPVQRRSLWHGSMRSRFMMPPTLNLRFVGELRLLRLMGRCAL
jgi:hypothetical protein